MESQDNRRPPSFSLTRTLSSLAFGRSQSSNQTAPIAPPIDAIFKQQFQKTNTAIEAFLKVLEEEKKTLSSSDLVQSTPIISESDAPTLSVDPQVSIADNPSTVVSDTAVISDDIEPESSSSFSIPTSPAPSTHTSRAITQISEEIEALTKMKQDIANIYSSFTRGSENEDLKDEPEAIQKCYENLAKMKAREEEISEKLQKRLDVKRSLSPVIDLLSDDSLWMKVAHTPQSNADFALSLTQNMATIGRACAESFPEIIRIHLEDLTHAQIFCSLIQHIEHCMTEPPSIATQQREEILLQMLEQYMRSYNYARASAAHLTLLSFQAQLTSLISEAEILGWCTTLNQQGRPYPLALMQLAANTYPDLPLPPENTLAPSHFFDQEMADSSRSSSRYAYENQARLIQLHPADLYALLERKYFLPNTPPPTLDDLIDVLRVLQIAWGHIDPQDTVLQEQCHELAHNFLSLYTNESLSFAPIQLWTALSKQLQPYANTSSLHSTDPLSLLAAHLLRDDVSKDKPYEVSETYFHDNQTSLTALSQAERIELLNVHYAHLIPFASPTSTLDFLEYIQEQSLNPSLSPEQKEALASLGSRTIQHIPRAWNINTDSIPTAITALQQYQSIMFENYRALQKAVIEPSLAVWLQQNKDRFLQLDLRTQFISILNEKLPRLETLDDLSVLLEIVAARHQAVAEHPADCDALKRCLLGVISLSPTKQIRNLVEMAIYHPTTGYIEAIRQSIALEKEMNADQAAFIARQLTTKLPVSRDYCTTHKDALLDLPTKDLISLLDTLYCAKKSKIPSRHHIIDILTLLEDKHTALTSEHHDIIERESLQNFANKVAQHYHPRWGKRLFYMSSISNYISRSLSTHFELHSLANTSPIRAALSRIAPDALKTEAQRSPSFMSKLTIKGLSSSEVRTLSSSSKKSDDTRSTDTWSSRNSRSSLS